MNKLKWIIFVAVTFGFLAMLVIFSRSSQIDLSSVDIYAVQSASSKNGNIADHVSGLTGSKVTLIEYADFQCPGCASINPEVDKVVSDYSDKIQFVFRNFPLSNLHPNAKAAAAAAEAAGLQGKQWEMHNKLYEGQDNWKSLMTSDRTQFFVNYANDLGLDTNKFKADMASDAVNAKISYDQALGQKAGVDGTPTFYLNGTKLETATWSNDSNLRTAINDELNKAGIPLPE